MNYVEVASQLKAKHPEYANRDNKELVQKYIERFPEKASLIEFDDYTETPKKESSPLISKDITKEDVGNYAKGVAQSLSQGLMVGQAPHVSGVLNETINTPEKVYKAQSLRDLVDVYKGLGKDYLKSREKFKEEQGKFAEENPKTALASEMLGGLGAGGFSLLRGGNLLRQAIKGGLEGGLFGGLYGLSNTKGKGVDLKSGAIGTGLGSILGGTLGAGLPIGMKVARGTDKLLGTLGRLYGKGVDNVAEAVTPVQHIKNPLRELNIPEGTKVIDAEVVSNPTINNELRNAIKVNENLPVAQSKEIAPKSRDILANPKSTDDAYVLGKVRNYTPEQDFVIDYMIKDENVLNELAKGVDVGRSFGDYGKEATNGLKNLKKVVKNAEAEEYAKAGITDDYMLDGNKFVEDIENAIKKYKKSSRTKKADEDAGDKFFEEVLDEWAKNNGQISFGKLTSLTRDAYKNGLSVAKNMSKTKASSEYELWTNISNIISNLKKNDAKLSKPTKMYSDLSNAIENLEFATGLKLDNPKNFAKNFFSSARDRADGGIYDQAFEDFAKIINQYEGTKVLGDLPSKIRMAKVSYVLRDSAKDSKLSRDVRGAMTPTSWAKRKFAEAITGKNLSSEDYYRILAQRMLKGEVTPEDLNGTFRKIRIKGLTDSEANELYIKHKLLGKKAGLVPSVLSGLL